MSGTLWQSHQRICQTPIVENRPENCPSIRRKPSVKIPTTCGNAALSSDHLTESELKFCREYAIDHNGSRAYRSCFPTKSAETAKVNASKLLTKSNVCREIAAIKGEHLRATEITARRVLRELAAIAFQDPGDLYEADATGSPVLRKWNHLPPHVRRSIQSVRIKRRKVIGSDGQSGLIEEIDIRMHSKLDALDKLCRHLGLTQDGNAIKRLLDTLADRGQADSAMPAGGL